MLVLDYPFRLKGRVAGFSKVGYHTGADRQQRKSSVSVSVPSLGSLFYKMSSKYKVLQLLTGLTCLRHAGLFIRETYKEEILKSIRCCQEKRAGIVWMMHYDKSCAS